MKGQLVVAIAGWMFSGALLAQNGVAQGYLGANYSMLTYDEDNVSEDLEPSAGIVRFGAMMTPHIGLERRVGVGISDDSVTFQGVEVAGDIDRLFGAYLLGAVPVAEQFSIYGLVGFTDVKATFSAGGNEMSDDDSGFTYGGGFDIFLNSDIALNAEYTQYLDESGYALSSIAVGVKLLF